MVQRSASDNAAEIPAAISAEALAKVTDQLPQWLAWHRTPGLALAVVEAGRVKQTLAFGLADSHARTPLTPAHRFPSASLGKPVAACTLLRLIARRRIGLGEPVVNHLPRLVDAERRALAGISIRQVLSHSAGLPNWRPAGGLLKPAWPPGRVFAYSGESYLLAQHLTESLSGQSFDDAVRREVLDPCGMKSSGFRWNPTWSPLLATGHDMAGRPVRPRHYVDANAAYTFYSSVEDYARFLAEIARPAGVLHALLPSLTHPEVQLTSQLSWGPGFSIAAGENGPCLWHIGNAIHHVSIALLHPATGHGVVTMSNASGGSELCQQVITGLDTAAQSLPHWVERFFALLKPRDPS